MKIRIRKNICKNIILFAIFFASCSRFNQADFYCFPKELESLLPETTNYNIHKFVIPENEECPFVRWQLNGQSLFMQIDTGCHKNILHNHGIKKIFKSFKRMEEYKNTDFSFFVELEDNEYLLDPYSVHCTGVENNYDGYLGLDWLWKYNNVVLDYVNGRIDYNQKPISETSVPMRFDPWNKIYYITFIFNGQELEGALDTGSYSTKVNIGALGDEKTDNGVYLVRDFVIGDVHYDDMELKGMDETGGSEGAKSFFSKNNVLGYPCFKDHVIQLDFKNNVFRIK